MACSLDGVPREDSDRSLPNELPIHLACYRDDPDVRAVVHAHPPAVSPPTSPASRSCRSSGRTTSRRPASPPTASPVYPRSVLINTAALAAEMRAAMGDRPVCVLRGHGITTTGDDPRAGRRPRPRRRLAWPAWRAAWRPPAGPARRSTMPTSPSSPTSAAASMTRCCGGTTSGAWPKPGLALDGSGCDDRHRSDPRRHRRSGMIPAHVYSDPDVFELERERLFARAWVFLAHESEIPEPGDYVVRRIVDDSFIVARDEAGVVRVLLQHVPAPRHAGVPGRARQRVALPLPVPRVDVPQRRPAGRAAVPRGGLRRRRRLRARRPVAAARRRASTSTTG